jgi:hypothetical protein
VIADAGDDDFTPEGRVLEERRRQHDPALLVDVRLGRAGEHEAVHLPGLAAEGVETLEASGDEVLPPLPREEDEAAVHAARDDDSTAQRLAELCREGEPVLVVEGVLVFAE